MEHIRVGKYLDGVDKDPSKWTSIHMSNLADDIPAELIPHAMELTTQRLKARYEDILKRMAELDAPPTIVANYVKVLESIQNGRHTWIATLRRSLNRRSK